jgi:hypothetical protein
MIFPEGELEVCEDEKGIYFVSDKVDLEIDSLVFPVEMPDGMGTIEFFKRKVIFHPANLPDRTISAAKFVEIMQKNEEKET